MHKTHEKVEDVLTDERFLTWYFSVPDNESDNWQTMLEADPHLQSLNNEAKIIMKQLHFEERCASENEIAEAYRKLKEKISENSRGKKSPVISMKMKRKRWWLAAASIVILALGSIAVWNSFSNVTKTTHKTEFGQIIEQKLPDGTKVFLNANSSLSLGEDWDNNKPREVWIEGEAFFNVAKTANKQRFIVHASQFDVIVTGTQFNIVDRPGRTNIMLQEGSVVLKTKDGGEITMKPGEFVEFKAEQFNKKELPAANVASWKEHKLNFENTPVPEAARMITEIYGVELIAGDDIIKSKVLTGVMPNDDLNVLLEAIEATLECKAERVGEKIVLKSN
jgi:ferric-dicitrate binding protein FerR (iron transport regulator)